MGWVSYERFPPREKKKLVLDDDVSFDAWSLTGKAVDFTSVLEKWLVVRFSDKIRRVFEKKKKKSTLYTNRVATIVSPSDSFLEGTRGKTLKHSS